jgi:hypothetical protein
MPVSKKRKKDGKPVHRAEPAAPTAEHAHGPEGKPAGPPPLKANKPSNPFVANKTAVRSAQRGR